MAVRRLLVLMCTYCGCDAEALVAELMAEHEELSMLAMRARTALYAGDQAGAVSRCAELAGRFLTHGQREEEGLFRQLQLEHQAEQFVAGLESEHHRLQAGLAHLAGGDLTDIEPVLDLLADHATREDTDLFPAALILLSNDGWMRARPAGR